MFTLYRIGFCSISKVVAVQCEQEYVHCCTAKIAPLTVTVLVWSNVCKYVMTQVILFILYP